MEIRRVESDEQILSTRSVMLELRPSIEPGDYLPRVRRMMQSDGYRLAAAYEDGVCRAVAGYRFMEMLHCGPLLYVDDLNSEPQQRSKGFGRALLDWLKQEARGRGCAQLQLDSGVHRPRAHRFYFREGLVITAFHFGVEL
jgi:GNAT superfamily N-acetyltransferase